MLENNYEVPMTKKAQKQLKNMVIYVCPIRMLETAIHTPGVNCNVVSLIPSLPRPQ